MFVQIRHLSISVKNPERAAKILAEMTSGVAETFSSRKMSGAWVCVWNRENNHLIEFLPNYFLMVETDYGADFELQPQPQSFNSTHVQLEVITPVDIIKRIANAYGLSHKFRPNRGGPLYDVWLEDQCLIEFVSTEIRNLRA